MFAAAHSLSRSAELAGAVLVLCTLTWAGSAPAGPPSPSTTREMTSDSLLPTHAEAPVAGQLVVAAAVRATVVRRIQELLAKLDYEPGPADGQVGPKTRDAIWRYQFDAGLPLTGEPSEELKAHLERAVGAAQPQVVQPTPPPERSRREAPARQASDAGVQDLVDELWRLVDRGERQRAADRWFLAELRQIVQRYDWPWKTVLITDDFADGDYTRNPAWRVISGGFQVEPGVGLRSRGTASSGTTEPSMSEEEIPAAILGAILGRVVLSERQVGASQAEIRLARRVPRVFAVELSFQSLERGGALLFGPYREDGTSSGYRLAYYPGGERGLELLRRTGGGYNVVTAYDGRLNLEDGRFHTLQFGRDQAGNLSVRLDGKLMLETADRGTGSGFDGIALVNRGGDYVVRKVSLLGP